MYQQMLSDSVFFLFCFGMAMVALLPARQRFSYGCIWSLSWDSVMRREGDRVDEVFGMRVRASVDAK